MSREFDPRGLDARDRHSDPEAIDPRDVFMRNLDLPRGQERELVHCRERDYPLNRFECRTLSTVGAFRVVREHDLRDLRDASGNTPDRGLGHLERQGFIQRVPLSDKDRAVALTDRGRALLERHRTDQTDHRQQFYSGADRPRERSHDAQFYRA
jgi:DNA-binding MarR family transcriptional regulator